MQPKFDGVEVLHALPEIPFANAVLTIGTFDGVHLGHQQVLKKLIAASHARGMPSVAVSFVNHPKGLLRPDRAVESLGTHAQKIRWLGDLGLDVLVALTFTKELQHKSAELFLSELKEAFHFAHIVLGHDAQFGEGRRGNPEFVAAHAEEMEYTFEYLDAFKWHDLVVSSTEIRKAIRSGDLATAAELLGRPYSIAGEVVTGDGRGKEIGYPTANVDVIGRCLPPHGVYAVTATVDGATHGGIANLGRSPTLKQRDEPLLEVHLLDYSGSLYGKELEVEFHHFIRDEKQFADSSALKAQIAQDLKAL